MFSLIPSDANDPQGLMRLTAPNKQKSSCDIGIIGNKIRGHSTVHKVSCRKKSCRAKVGYISL